jgi:signal transduction histidine kinase
MQESLQNVQKHAGATVVQVTLRSLPVEEVELRIVDDGKGFERQYLRPAIPSGAGLLGMEERASLLGGRLTIDSTPGRGTTVTLHLPRRPGSPTEAEAVGRTAARVDVSTTIDVTAVPSGVER